MIIKGQLGKLQLQAPLRSILAQQQRNGIKILGVDLDHILALEPLPLVHRDPFDRLLIAQANVQGAVLISSDPIFKQYPVSVLW
jgi:PIN domain nuclease of toxin-antitoxin system